MAREFLLEFMKKEGRPGATFRTTVMLQPAAAGMYVLHALKVRLAP
jgi:hypothetical protein